MFKVVWPAVIVEPIFSEVNPKRSVLRLKLLTSLMAGVAMIGLVTFWLSTIRVLTDLAPIEELQWTLALSLATWATAMVWVAETATSRSLTVPSVSLPLLIPEQSTAETWTQPKVGSNDRLIEAEMVNDDGVPQPIVVVVTSSGLIKGYSRPLDGNALRLRWSPDDNPMPPEPK